MLAAFTLALLQQTKPPFYDDIQAFLKADKQNPPKKNQILFIGSSSFTRWTKVQEAFPTHPIINRGFGSSSLPDLIRYTDQIIFPYHPKQIVIYCGENDLAGDATLPAHKVYDRFRQLFITIRTRLPKTPIVYISMKPSPSRKGLMAKMIAANKWIADYLATQPRTKFIDVFPLMLDGAGSPRPELFGSDMLHMNEKGYAIWTKVIEPVLLP